MQSKLLVDVFVMECPHCGASSEDTLEVMDAEVVHGVRCQGCAAGYFVTIKECLGCGAETVFTSAQEPAEAVVNALMCAQCARSFRVSEEGGTDAHSAH
jgi:transcription elongation factor Elf1